MMHSRCPEEAGGTDEAAAVSMICHCLGWTQTEGGKTASQAARENKVWAAWFCLLDMT